MKSSLAFLTLLFLAFATSPLHAHGDEDHGSDAGVEIPAGTEQPDVAEEPSVASKAEPDAAKTTVKRQYKDHDGNIVEKAVPTDVAQLWKEIYAQQAELTKIVEAGDVGGVHDATETLNVYLRKLPEISDMLDATSRQKVATQVQVTTQVVDKIHNVGDQGGFQDAKAQLPTLDKMLTLLSKQYPQEVVGQAINAAGQAEGE